MSGESRRAGASELHAPARFGVPDPAVKEIQRGRLLAAALRQCAATGSAELTVAGIVSAAGVSRRTFYDLFPDVGACLLALIEERLETAGDIARAAFAQHRSWSEGVRAGLGALLCHFEGNPDVARVLIVETLRAGPRVAAVRRETVARLVAVLRHAGEDAGSGSFVCALSGEAAVAAVLGILHDRLSSQARPRLSPLVNELMCVIVAPYLGAAAARRQLGREQSTEVARAGRRQRSFQQPPMRLTYRTMRALVAIGRYPGGSNRQIGLVAGIEDQGQVSKLLARLRRLGLIENGRSLRDYHGPNAWRLTAAGRELEREISRPALRRVP